MDSKIQGYVGKEAIDSRSPTATDALAEEHARTKASLETVEKQIAHDRKRRFQSRISLCAEGAVELLAG